MAATNRQSSGSMVPLPLCALIAFIQVVGSTAAGHRQPDRRSLDLVAYLLLLAGPAALALGRSQPRASLTVVTGATLVYLSADYAYGPVVLSLVVAVMASVVNGHRTAAWIAATSLYVGHFGWTTFFDHAHRVPWQAMLASGAWLLVVLAVGEIVSGRKDRWAQMARAREEETARRIGEERLRIAREVHDVVAHNLALVNVQAGVALHLLETGADDDGRQTRHALSTIKQTSKDALAELRGVLGVLREHETADALAPRNPLPRLADWHELVDNARSSGLAVEVEIGLGDTVLPPAVDLAAYRVLQEALTNAMRHAAGAHVHVTITRSADVLDIDVRDDGGRGHVDDVGTGAGSGLIGMRERVGALGGTLVAEPLPDKGFHVKATLPLVDER